MVESWCVGLIPLRASLQYSNTPIPRKQLRLCLTLCAILYALCSPGEAQQPTKVPRIGYLTVASLSSNAARVEAFRQGLRELGHLRAKISSSSGDLGKGNSNDRVNSRRKQFVSK